MAQLAFEAGRHQEAQLRLVGLGESLDEQVRKSIRRTLRQSCEHFGIQLPVLGLALRSEHAALGGPVEAFLQFLGIHAAEKLLEGGASRGERGGVLGFELAKVLPYRLDGAGTGGQRGQQSHQRLVDAA